MCIDSLLWRLAEPVVEVWTFAIWWCNSAQREQLSVHSEPTCWFPWFSHLAKWIDINVSWDKLCYSIWWNVLILIYPKGSQRGRNKSLKIWSGEVTIWFRECFLTFVIKVFLSLLKYLQWIWSATPCCFTQNSCLKHFASNIRVIRLIPWDAL